MQTNLYIHIPVEDAFARGEVNAGDMEIPVTEDLLRDLSAEERVILARYCSTVGTAPALRLRVASSAWSQVLDVVAQIQKSEHEYREKQAALALLNQADPDHLVTQHPEERPGYRWRLRKDLPYEASEARSRGLTEASRRNAIDWRAHQRNLLEESVDQHIHALSDGVWIASSDLHPPSSTWVEPADRQAYERARAEAIRRNDDQRAKAQARQRAQEQALIAKHGSSSQQERWGEGVLPDEEIRQIARDVIFAAITVPIRQRIMFDEIPHTPDCLADVTMSDGDVTSVDTEKATEFSSAEWEALKALRLCLDSSEWHFDIDVRRRAVQCDVCSESVARLEARVSTTWADRVLAREYDLSGCV